MLQLRKSYDIGVVVSVRGIHIYTSRLNRREFRAILLAGNGRNKVERVHDSCYVMCIVCVACLHRVKRL